MTTKDQAGEAENVLEVADRGLEVVEHGADADEGQQERAEHIGGQGVKIASQLMLEYSGHACPSSPSAAAGASALCSVSSMKISSRLAFFDAISSREPRPGKGEEEGAGDVVEACLPSGFEVRGDETALLRRDGPAGDGADAVQKGAHLLLRPLGGQGDLVGGEQAALQLVGRAEGRQPPVGDHEDLVADGLHLGQDVGS